MQKYVWTMLEQGFSTAPNPRWTHEDNQMALRLGWCLAANPYGNSTKTDPKSALLDIISYSHATPHEVFLRIQQGAELDPLLAKALSILTAQRLLHPEVLFAYQEAHVHNSEGGRIRRR